MQRPHRALLAALLTMIVVQAAFGQRKTIRPGWNLFSKEQDIALGHEAAAEIETQVEVVDDQRLTEYIGKIGERLAAASQDPSYPFTFKVVADPSINAFALPGGPTYVNSGLIAAADNEAQLAGVMAHEIGHVVLRHSTNQASKRSLFQLPAVIAAGALGGSGGMLGSLANIGIGFGLNSVFMKYSRSAERDADIVGARMMAAVGYDPVEMAHFFEKLEEAGAASGPQFLSDHPNPGNRVQYITEEIASYRDDSYTTTSPAFASMRSRAANIESATQESVTTSELPNAAVEEQGIAEPVALSPTKATGPGYEFLVPDHWQAYVGSNAATTTVVPSDGANRPRRGRTSIRRGILAGYFAASGTLTQATHSFIENLQLSNIRLILDPAQQKNFHADHIRAESNFLVGPSTTVRGERENLWVVTAQRPQGLFYLVMISPVDEYGALYPGFQRALSSLRFSEEQPAAPPTSTAGIFAGQGYTFPYPPDWTVQPNATADRVRITPTNGVLRNRDGTEAITRGYLVGLISTDEPLENAADRLLERFQTTNPSLRLVRGQRKPITVDDRQGVSIFLEGPSSLEGQREYVWIVTVSTNEGLFYLAMISPQGEYRELYPTFKTTIDSIEFD